MRRAIALSKIEALHVIGRCDADELELDYPTAWRDAVELGRLGMSRGIRVTTKGTEYVFVSCPNALLTGLSLEKRTYRQRNLCCNFPKEALPDEVWNELQRKARLFGDFLVDGSFAGMVFDHQWQ
ncbi:PHA-granule associated protein 4 [Cupriavidus taiwanensis]|uniref:PHA-granule associated protein 4 n=1 Tax=Cupriavidus taiwanensis TaxID=164546 RepID=UPI000E1A33EB|nr:PHA-granule associated protein 4 [Cupriavidus taiwanensis]SOY93307.1 PHA-granule associated protein 4 [Cupriavidus taiwanensis]SOY96447.1 PHA-granule associated protein 4 [Cupriavidus taiwanensis]